MQVGEAPCDTVLHHVEVIISRVRISNRRLDTVVRRDPGDNQALDASHAQLRLESRVEEARASMLDEDLIFGFELRLQFLDDLLIPGSLETRKDVSFFQVRRDAMTLARGIFGIVFLLG